MIVVDFFNPCDINTKVTNSQVNQNLNTPLATTSGVKIEKTAEGRTITIDPIKFNQSGVQKFTPEMVKQLGVGLSDDEAKTIANLLNSTVLPALGLGLKISDIKVVNGKITTFVLDVGQNMNFEATLDANGNLIKLPPPGNMRDVLLASGQLHALVMLFGTAEQKLLLAKLELKEANAQAIVTADVNVKFNNLVDLIQAGNSNEMLVMQMLKEMLDVRHEVLDQLIKQDAESEKKYKEDEIAWAKKQLVKLMNLKALKNRLEEKKAMQMIGSSNYRILEYNYRAALSSVNSEIEKMQKPTIENKVYMGILGNINTLFAAQLNIVQISEPNIPKAAAVA